MRFAAPARAGSRRTPRASPSATALADAGVRIGACDPEGTEAAQVIMPDLTYCDDVYDAANGADAAVIVTEGDVFRALDLDRLKAAMATPVLVDLRNVYRRDVVEQAGFAYVAVGR